MEIIDINQMKANELRIGNWVLINTMITKINMARYIGDIDDDKIIAEPIPLTEEWLLKFGLKTGYNHLFGFITKDYNTYYLEDGEGYNITSKPIEYVHQLQNLYFALTGEELKYV